MSRKDNDGKSFEALTKEVYKILTQDEDFTTVEGPRVFLDSPDGEREFDLVIRTLVAGMELLTVVECRDWKTKLDVQHLDGFVGKMNDVKANKGVLVARAGFSKKAISKAKREGVTLCVARDNESLSREIKSAAFRLPVIVVEIGSLTCSLTVATPTIHVEIFKPKKEPLLNGKSVIEHIKDAILAGKIAPRDTQGQIWMPFSDTESVALRFERGIEKHANGMHVQFVYSMNNVYYYFGYADDLPNSKSFEKLIEKSSDQFLSIGDFIGQEYRDRFQKFDTDNDVPDVGAINLHVLVAPDRLYFGEPNTKLVYVPNKKSPFN